MAIWQYTFWIDYKWNKKELLKDLESIFGSKVEEKGDMIYFVDWESDCRVFLDDNSIFCRLSLIEKEKLEKKLEKLKEISIKYNLKFLVWKEYIWEKKLDYDNFEKELYSSNNMKFVEWNYWEFFAKVEG